ncbi:enoyl-CoA hydratase/isomerase family protein [Acuticoccus sp. I52.16.1]|uniref:enoyl-CoA hydratase/isomerase family protein n=1 Tax=Acuticoccus sp. I52.16.1 TaxID=2928472 RepID=UPI001FD51A56|nr:enoyl-CoA hydratase-related protein [Acuticoccus sp. I52.16.1]UOM33310.1 enoyl-CoA hydratase-related protein [Acuticoccus sp. I52.16.1]
MTYQTLTHTRHGDHVDVVTLTRPEARNALDTQMGHDLIAVFEAYQLDTGGARCIVLTGDGDKAFCAGGDLKQRLGMTDAAWNAQHRVFERMARAIVACPVPVIAAVNGAAFGGGCEIAAACDFIYAADTARFAQTEVKLGIIPGAGGTQNLPRAMGQRRAMEVILTGAPFTAAEGHAWGFVNRVLAPDELMAAALATAATIAANAPLAVNRAKQAVRRGLDMSLGDGMAFEIEAYAPLVATDDRREGTAAFNEKRSPRFTGS